MQQLVHFIAQYGLAFVFVNVLPEQIGLPIPAIPTLVVAGALAMDGVISPLATLGAALLACTLGDAAWYTAGRVYGSRVMRLLCRISLSPDSCVRQTEYRFGRWGALTLVLAKFIPGLSTIAPPLAGSMRLSWVSFLFFNSVGAVLWAGIAIGAGRLFHAEVNDLVGRLGDLGTTSFEIVGVLLAAYIAFKWWERRSFYKMLRIARITAEELRTLMDNGTRPVVVDVRSPLIREEDARFIPGALAIDIGDVNRRLEDLPPEREVVFYCNCPNEASAASVAKQLIERGYTRVRPLQGGLDAWVAAGYEVEHRPALGS